MIGLDPDGSVMERYRNFVISDIFRFRNERTEKYVGALAGTSSVQQAKFENLESYHEDFMAGRIA